VITIPSCLGNNVTVDFYRKIYSFDPYGRLLMNTNQSVGQVVPIFLNYFNFTGRYIIDYVVRNGTCIMGSSFAWTGSSS